MVAGKKPEAPACAAQVRRGPGRARWDTWGKPGRPRAHCVSGKASGAKARSEPDWAKDTDPVREGRKSAPRRIMPDSRIHCQDTSPLKGTTPPRPLHRDWPRVLLLLSLLSPLHLSGRSVFPATPSIMLFSALFLLSSLHNVVAQRLDADLMSFVTVSSPGDTPQWRR